MSKSAEELIKFYKEDSSFSHTTEAEGTFVCDSRRIRGKADEREERVFEKRVISHAASFIFCS